MSSDGFFLRLTFFAAALLLCMPLLADAEPWAALTPVQQEALEPLSRKWDTLPEKKQRYYLNLAKHYPELSPEKKHRLHERLEPWENLTPEQRRRAREKRAAFNKVPPEKREQVKRMVRERESAKAAASGVPPALTAK